jgi:hypothetical protein
VTQVGVGLASHRCLHWGGCRYDDERAGAEGTARRFLAA